VFYPAIGSIAIVCMLAPSIYALVKGGRGWCGTYCPRGSFNDLILSKASLNRNVPVFLKSRVFRIIFLVVLMTIFVVQLVLAWGSAFAVGMVFVRMIIVTTIITVILGVLYKPRTWCHFCPMGTMAYYVSKWVPLKNDCLYVQFDRSLCVKCTKCSRTCPMSLDVLSHKDTSIVNDDDSIKCGKSVLHCPKNSLNLDKRKIG
jgi:polyferredoxin